VCLYNHWNPYSEEIKKIPDIFWVFSFHMLQMKVKDTWERKLKPHAEFIGFLVKPQMYKIYKEEEKKRDKLEALKGGQEITSNTPSSMSGAGVADTYFDRDRGLVDANGKVIIPKDQYEKIIGVAGVAISF
jgi:hypothetical protein